MAYVSQAREEQLDPEASVYEEVSEGNEVIKVGEASLHVRKYLNMVKLFVKEIVKEIMIIIM
jgi:hypothetical protein